MGVTLERRTGRWSSLMILVGLVGAGIASLAYLTSPFSTSPSSDGTLDDEKIHVPLFVDPNSVRPTPRFRFSFDPPEALAPLRAEENLDAVIDGAPDDLARCRRLTAWARRQWEPGMPNPYPPLDARVILRDIRRGFTGGFDAQYNYVLVQALQSVGIPARYVSLVGHEVVEARLPDTGWWVCLDPLHDTYYTDETGRPLSVIEIHERLSGGRPIALPDGHRVADFPAHMEAFRSFAVWLKNDHVSSPANFTDLERYKVYFLDGDDAARRVPPGALATSEPADIYPG